MGALPCQARVWHVLSVSPSLMSGSVDPSDLTWRFASQSQCENLSWSLTIISVFRNEFSFYRFIVCRDLALAVISSQMSYLLGFLQSELLFVQQVLGPWLFVGQDVYRCTLRVINIWAASNTVTDQMEVARGESWERGEERKGKERKVWWVVWWLN